MGHFNERYLPMEEIVREYLAGATANQLATKYECTCHTILKRLRKEGIATRKHADAYSVLSDEARLAMTSAAHDAKRGKPAKESSKLATAATVEKKAAGGENVSVLENRFIAMLSGVRPALIPVQQKAVGFYNVDIALTESCVAVEIFGGHWHAGGRHAERYRRRIEYILGAGWLPVIIWVSSVYPLTTAAANYVVALHDVRCSDKSQTTEEHVIWGTGEFIPVSERDPITGARKRRADRA
jgi:very-short-patch-repair endonuclease